VIIKAEEYDILIENPEVKVRIENNNRVYVISGKEKKIEKVKRRREERDINDVLREINNDLLEAIFVLRR